MDILHMHVHDGLDHGTLRSQHDDLIVGIVEGGTNAPRITHAERLATTGNTTYHETTVPGRYATAQDVRQIHMLLDRLRDLHAFQALAFIMLIQPLHLAIQTMAELLQHDVGVCVFAGMLTYGCDFFKYLMHIG